MLHTATQHARRSHTLLAANSQGTLKLLDAPHCNPACKAQPHSAGRQLPGHPQAAGSGFMPNWATQHAKRSRAGLHCLDLCSVRLHMSLLQGRAQEALPPHASVTVQPLQAGAARCDGWASTVSLPQASHSL